jgi:hypothetical protein
MRNLLCHFKATLSSPALAIVYAVEYALAKFDSERPSTSMHHTMLCPHLLTEESAHKKASLTQSRPARPPLAPAHEDARTQHLVGLRRWGLVPVRMLTVGADAVAKLHAQRAVSERSRVGAAERARPQGVGVDVFGELEFLFRDASLHHEVHPDAVTHGLMRHGRVGPAELVAVLLQLEYEKLFIEFPRKLVRGCVSGRCRASIRKTVNRSPSI